MCVNSLGEPQSLEVIFPEVILSYDTNCKICEFSKPPSHFIIDWEELAKFTKNCYFHNIDYYWETIQVKTGQLKKIEQSSETPNMDFFAHKVMDISLQYLCGNTHREDCWGLVWHSVYWYPIMSA